MKDPLGKDRLQVLTASKTGVKCHDGQHLSIEVVFEIRMTSEPADAKPKRMSPEDQDKASRYSGESAIAKPHGVELSGASESGDVIPKPLPKKHTPMSSAEAQNTASSTATTTAIAQSHGVEVSAAKTKAEEKQEKENTSTGFFQNFPYCNSRSPETNDLQKLRSYILSPPESIEPFTTIDLEGRRKERGQQVEEFSELFEKKYMDVFPGWGKHG